MGFTIQKSLFCRAKQALLDCESDAFAMQNNRFYRAKQALLDCNSGSFAERKDGGGARDIVYMRVKVFVLQHKRYGFFVQHYPISLQVAMNQALTVARK